MADSQENTDASVSTFVSSIVFTSAISAILFLVFTVVRKRYPRVYAPKTYMGPSRERPESNNEGLLGWVFGSRKLNDLEVIDRCGLDAYMFLEFLNKAFFLFMFFAFFAIPVLIPLNAFHQLDLVGLNQFTIANILDQKRLWGHVWLAVLFCGATMAVCFLSIRRFISRRQQYLTSDHHSQSIQANTILITGLLKGEDNLQSLQQAFGSFPGGIRRVWMAYGAAALQKECTKRIALTNKLETAECALIKSRLKLQQEGQGEAGGRRPSGASQGSTDLLSQQQVANLPVGDDAFPPEKRPKHRPATFPMTLFTSCCGAEKVDSITTYRSELSNMNSSILARQQAGLGAMHDNQDQDKMSSAFLQFNNQMGAHAAMQAVDKKATVSRGPGFLEVHPKDVIWDNLGLTPTSRLGRKTISTLLALALIILWAVPVAFVASVAKLDAIVKFAPFLKGVYDLPKIAVGVIQGLLPPIGLAVLMMILPMILYKLAHLGGAVLNSTKTLQVMTSYHWFSVVHVLLVTTLANGIFAAIQQIKDNPSQIMSMLASTLPQASTFFLSFILLSLIGIPMMLLQIGPLIMYHVGKFLSSTPRQMYTTERTMGSVDWGTTVPVHTIAFAIGLIYSTIQPIILPFMVIYFGMYYLAFRHMFLYVYRQPFDTGGQIFPRIVDQIYVAVIIFELVMLGLFILQKAIGQSVIMFLAFVSTVVMIAYTRHRLFKSPLKYIPAEAFNSRGLESGAGYGSTAGGDVGLEQPSGVIGQADPGNHHSTPTPISTSTSVEIINAIPAQASFHEKSPYKDPASPSPDPETSKEIYSPDPSAKSPVALSSPARVPFSESHEMTDSPSLGTGQQQQSSKMSRQGSARSNLSTDSPIPSITVENTTHKTATGSTTPSSSILQHQRSPSISQSDTQQHQQHRHDQHHRQQSGQQYRPQAALLQPFGGGTGSSTNSAWTAKSASLQVLGANHSILSSNDPAAETMVPDAYAYVNPGLWIQPQPVWLPKDPRGFAELETLELNNAGLSTTTDSATMDANGRVAVEVSQREVAPGDVYWD